jgi:hypothetical protein
MSLPAPVFIHRFLQHVLPPGFHHIRYYGLLGGSRRRSNLIRCRQLLGLADPETPYIADLDAYLTKQGIDHSLFPVWCPICGKGHMHNIYRTTPPASVDPSAQHAHAPASYCLTTSSATKKNA